MLSSELQSCLATSPNDSLLWSAYADALEEESHPCATITRLFLELTSTTSLPRIFQLQDSYMAEYHRGHLVPLPRKVIGNQDFLLIPPGRSLIGPLRQAPAPKFKHLPAFWLATHTVLNSANMSYNAALTFATQFKGTLPTHHEFEYATRAGTTTPYYSGIHVPGTHSPNQLGLYQMTNGPFWQWCFDADTPTAHVMGGPGATSFNVHAYRKTTQTEHIGFRLAAPA